MAPWWIHIDLSWSALLGFRSPMTLSSCAIYLCFLYTTAVLCPQFDFLYLIKSTKLITSLVLVLLRNHILASQTGPGYHVAGRQIWWKYSFQMLVWPGRKKLNILWYEIKFQNHKHVYWLKCFNPINIIHALSLRFYSDFPYPSIFIYFMHFFFKF